MSLNRRSLLKSLGIASFGAATPQILHSEIKVKHRLQKRKIETDVLVIGGGTAGVIAAIQAGRLGKKVILLECGSQLGGTTTTGGVSYPGIFFAWGKQVIGGIGWELVKEAVDLNNDKLPDFSKPHGNQHWEHQIRVNKALYTMLAEEKCLEAGVKIRFYESPTKMDFNGTSWTVESIGKGVVASIVASQVIDCTGNAFAAQLAGYEVLRDAETQPGTLIFKIDGYDINNVDIDQVQEAYLKSVEKGDLVKEHFRGSMKGLLRSKGDNFQHIMGADSTTSETHTKANIEGRQSLIQHLRFLRQFPGLENTHLVDMQTETAVRESYRINGLYKVTHDDYAEGKKFSDAVSYSYYPIDLHNEHGVYIKYFEEGMVATIPYRSLIPINSSNFLVAGRCLSSDRLANSALRVQASSMAMGQVAGAAASIACDNKCSPTKINFDNLLSTLEEQGAIVPR